MKKTFIFLTVILFSGCSNIRFAPNETQKQNAWLHNKTALLAAQTAKNENASPKLQSLADLSQLQSRSFVAYYGMPNQIPDDSEQQILSQNSIQLAQNSLNDSQLRPDGWIVADNLLEFSIALAGLFGGVYGARTVQFLKQAKEKSNALKEIIDGNELFKQQNQSAATAFKTAHKKQSAPTRKLVAELKT